MLWLDFETRSRCDLNSHGAYNYAQDPSTQVLCMSYAFDDEDVIDWRPEMPFPQRVAEYTGQIRAHNANFERSIFWYVLCPDYNVPEPKLEQFYCTATQARANCAPGKLEDLGRFASLSMQKDYRGAQLIRQLCIPRKDGSFNDDPILMKEFFDYCAQDVRTMREASKNMRELTAEELHDYHVNERINDRGILIDVALAKSAVKYDAQEKEELNQQLILATNGELTSAQSPKICAWVRARVGPEANGLMQVIKNDEIKYSLDKNTRFNLLVLAEENPDEVPADVAEVISIADDARASSISKFKKLAALADVADNRVRGAFIFAGAVATGRASSYGAQLHNFPRKALKNSKEARNSIVQGDDIVPRYGSRVSDVLRGMLRPAIIPAKGKILLVADWSAIEARVNPWLSDCESGREKLELFRTGQDIYKHNASATFNVSVDEVDSEQRQVGKVQELACGFAGGVGAFAAMAKIYNLAIAQEDSHTMVQKWRLANPWATQYWAGLERAYRSAMRYPNTEFTCARITYFFNGQHLWYMLPSGRILCYPYAKIDIDGVSYAKASYKPKADANEWPRGRLWKGTACENGTQAVAHDILRHSLRTFDALDVDAEIIAHVHDEGVIECPINKADEITKIMHEVMCTPPDWCPDLPLAVEIKAMERYGK